MNKMKELMLRKKQRIVDSMKEQESLFTKKIEEIEEVLVPMPDIVAEIPEDVVIEMPAKAKAAQEQIKKKRSKKK